MVNAYPIKCILPHDRYMQIDNSNLIECSCSYTDIASIITTNNYNSDSHSYKELHHSNATDGLIKLYGNHTTDHYRYVTYDSLGDQLSFVYTSRLVFLHEKDLRNIVYNSIGHDEVALTYAVETSSSSYRDEIMSGGVHSMLSIRYIGVVSSGFDMGYGVYTEGVIKDQTFLGEYVGVVSSMNETTEHSNHFNALYPDCDGGYSINAREYGNIIRFINHSNDPNAEFKAVKIDELMHVICVSSIP